MLKSYKYRLRPTGEQKVFFEKSFGCARYVYNWALDKKIKVYEEDKTSISYVQLAKMLTDLKKEKGKEWLSEVTNETLQQSLRNLDTAYSNFFRTKKGFPKFKSKHNNKHSFKNINNVDIDLENNKVKIPKLGWVRFYANQAFVGTIKSITVSKSPTNKYYVSVLVDNGIDLPNKQAYNESNTVGLDVGVKDFAVLSNGHVYKNPKHLEKSSNRLKRIQRKFSKSKKGGKRREKLRLKLARQYEKVTNQRNDFLHKVSSKLVRENQAIVIENLNICGMMKNHKLARSISSVSWSTFFTMLEYKCEWQGKTLIRINRFAPSSKKCRCGYINKDLKLHQRTWICPECRIENDRDLNAAVNIKNFGLEPNLITEPMVHRGLDDEKPTMDERVCAHTHTHLKSSASVKRQIISV